MKGSCTLFSTHPRCIRTMLPYGVSPDFHIRVSRGCVHVQGLTLQSPMFSGRACIGMRSLTTKRETLGKPEAFVRGHPNCPLDIFRLDALELSACNVIGGYDPGQLVPVSRL